jgi:hypothetical protein
MANTNITFLRHVFNYLKPVTDNAIKVIRDDYKYDPNVEKIITNFNKTIKYQILIFYEKLSGTQTNPNSDSLNESNKKILENEDALNYLANEFSNMLIIDKLYDHPNMNKWFNEMQNNILVEATFILKKKSSKKK